MSEHSGEHNAEQKDAEYPQPRLNEVAQKFLADLDEERSRLTEAFPLCALLIDEAFDRVYSTGRIPGKEFHADVYKQKPMKLCQKVFVPVKQYPKFNFTGKILGPKGNSLRRLQEETQCKIAIKGRNSIRDRNKEEELRQSGDPRFAHLQRDLFLEITTVATPAECYARIAYALAEIRKYLVPDKNDDVSHEQLRELMEIDPQSAKHLNNMPHMNKSVLERKMTVGVSAPKYLSLIKQPQGYEEHEEKHETEHYDPYHGARPVVYEYPKARAFPSTYKRPQASPYAPDTKRLREAPMKTYTKPTSYNILKKYK